MLKKLGIGLAVIVIALVAVIATRPSEFRVERSATIPAPAHIVFAEINDFHRWAAWSPWQKLDSAMKTTYEGPAAGVGASYYWSGNDKIGEGRMTIAESKPNERIGIKLEFIRPFAGISLTEFSLKPEGNGVQVTWAMSGTNNFMAKAFSLVMNMDKMVGGDFERGLASLGQVSEAAEAQAKKRAEEARAAAEAAKKAHEAEAAKEAAEAAVKAISTHGAP